jgi:hypothetical protein
VPAKRNDQARNLHTPSQTLHQKKEPLALAHATNREPSKRRQKGSHTLLYEEK